MEKFNDELQSFVYFRPANSLSASEPPVPELSSRTRVLETGSVHAAGAYPLPCDILLEQDTAISLRDGTTVWADVFRPTTDEAVPVILCYTPYGKRGGWWNENFNATKFGAAPETLSGLQAFESPDPGFWVENGYALVYVDAAGTSRSGGDEVFMGSASGRNVYDVIEWLAGQEWSTGKVGMSGNSQLAMIQWAAAALNPPHLAAIAPWEGLSDLYREVSVRGGIPDVKFHSEDISAWIYGEYQTEDVTGENIDQFPLMTAYWADKRAQIEQITAPAYVVASWTSPLHTHGTLQAFRELRSEQKWLRIHNDQEWIDGTDPVNVRDLQKFFDRYLKGAENDWESTPRVRLSVLDPGGEDLIGREEADWPLSRQQVKAYFLDARTNELSDELIDEESAAEYDSTNLESSVRFTTVLANDIEVTGYLNLHLWVETDVAEDMDLFAAMYKESADGTRQHHITLRSPEARGFVRSMEQNGLLPATLAYTGPVGRLRVSHRELDADRSTASEPVLAHASEKFLSPGECVPVELSLWPTSMMVHAGERLVIEIAGHPVGPIAAPTLPGGWLEIPTRNQGMHRIRTGGQYDSQLTLPVV